MPMIHVLVAILGLVLAIGPAEAATWLKQSTAVDIKLGPFVDQTDGFTAETALTIAQADVRLAKNAGAWAQKNETTSCTHEENGWYECPLNTTDTNTLGILIVAVNEAGALPVWREFLVVPATAYDGLVDDVGVGVRANMVGVVGVAATLGVLPAAAAGASGGLPTVDANNTVKVQAGTGTGQLDFTSGRIKADTVFWNAAAVATPNTAGVPRIDVDRWINVVPNALTSGKVDAIGVIRSATAQAGGASTITLDTGASATNDLYKNEIITILSGTGAGQTNTVSSYDGTTKVATMIATWATNPDATSVFAIQPQGPISATVAGNVTVGAYAAGQNPADHVLVTPANKLATDANNRVVVQVGTGAGQLDTTSGQIKVQQGTGAGQLDTTSGQVKIQTGTGAGQLDLSSGRLKNDEPYTTVDAVKAATTSRRYQVFIKDERTGAGLTGLTNASSGLTAHYFRDGATTATAISLSAGTVGTWSSGGFKEIDATNLPGWYELGLPNAMIDTGSALVTLNFKGAANMMPTTVYLALVTATSGDIIASLRVLEGTAQAGCTAPCATITLPATASAVNNTYNNQTVHLTGGTGSGQTCTITSYVGSTKVATCTVNWVTAPDTTTQLSVLPESPGIATVTGNVTVGAYIAGQNPADFVLVTPANKLVTDASGRIQVQPGTGTGQVNLSTGRVGINWADVLNPTTTVSLSGTTVGTTTALTTNNDKTGYSLTQAFPTNFSSLAVTAGGAVTAGTVSDKTGYSLTQAFPGNFSSFAITGGGAVTAGTVSDKTGYSLTQGFPTNFASSLITAAGVQTPGGTIRKNIASQTYPIYLVLTTDHISPATGKTVTVSVSKDGAAFGAITGTVAEIGSGWYLVSLSQADSNCNTCAFTTSAAATDARAFYFVTAP